MILVKFKKTSNYLTWISSRGGFDWCSNRKEAFAFVSRKEAMEAVSTVVFNIVENISWLEFEEG